MSTIRKIYGEFGYVTVSFVREKDWLVIKTKDGTYLTYSYNDMSDKTDNEILSVCIQWIEDLGLL